MKMRSSQLFFSSLRVGERRNEIMQAFRLFLLAQKCSLSAWLASIFVSLSNQAAHRMRMAEVMRYSAKGHEMMNIDFRACNRCRIKLN